MEAVCVASVDAFGDTAKKVVRVDGVEIGVFRSGDNFYAWVNSCPHQGGPVCQGRLYNKVVEVLDDEKRTVSRAFDAETTHIVCPWHGAEFDIRTGKHAASDGLALTPVDVFVESGEVFVRAVPRRA